MSRLFPGAKVPNRKPAPNPCTITGFPRINTYAKLDCQPTSYDCANTIVRTGDRALGHKDPRFTPCTKKNGRGCKKRLAPENLCHRARAVSRQHEALNDRHFESARILIVQRSQAKVPQLRAGLEAQFALQVSYLHERKCFHRLSELGRLVAARGQHDLTRYL